MIYIYINGKSIREFKKNDQYVFCLGNISKMMSDRKAELERKKAKLQAIREEKERRRREKEQKDVSFFLFKNLNNL